MTDRCGNAGRWGSRQRRFAPQGATLPDNFIAFEYPARFEPFWYDITEGFDGMPVKDGLIDVPDRPGLGVELIPELAKKYLSEGDAGFFD